jgi:hypothetical protein
MGAFDTPCRVSIDELRHDTQGQDPEPFMDQAREELKSKLQEGKTVAGCSVVDLLDTKLNGDTFKSLLLKLGSLLLADRGEHGAIADAIRDELIDDFLKDGIGEEAVREEAAEIAHCDDTWEG